MNKWTVENKNVNFTMDKQQKIFKIFIDGTPYKQCAMCGEFYKTDGNNTKYCKSCKSRANSIKAVERNRKRLKV